MTVPRQYAIQGESASAIVDSVERGIREARLAPNAALPTVRALAASLKVSPTTVAAAYATLRTRGLVAAQGRRGTRVIARPAVTTPGVAFHVPEGVRNLGYGNPDPAMLPPLAPVLARLGKTKRLYGERTNDPDLLAIATRQFESDGLPAGSLAVVGGALDAIERVLQAHLRPGDRIALEDPGYVSVYDLVGALGLVPEPVAVDDRGLVPTSLAHALRAKPAALVLTPRAQNPTGAALDERRVRELRTILDRHPDALIVEDDHAGPVAGAPALTLCHRRARWAIVRSVSKSLGPDLRVGLLVGDDTTIARVAGRQQLGPGWVSHILQAAVARLLADRATLARLEKAADTYTERRRALVDALAAHGIESHGASGLNVWVPVPEESRVVTALAAAGYGVRAGERYRLKSPPAIRVTVSALEPREALRVADEIARALRPAGRTSVA